jgi:hypothetical protein
MAVAAWLLPHGCCHAATDAASSRRATQQDAKPLLAVGGDGVVTPQHWQALAEANFEARPSDAAAGGAAGAAADGAAGGVAAAPGSGAAVPSGTPLPGSTVPGALTPPPARAAQQQGGGGGGGGRSLGSLVWFFGVYFFFQWLLGRSS